jgi:hypothetical protein
VDRQNASIRFRVSLCLHACILIAKPCSWMAHIIIRHQGTPLLFHCMRKRKTKGKNIPSRDRGLFKGVVVLCCAQGRSAARRVAFASPGCQTLSASEAFPSHHFCFEAEKLGIGIVREACLTTWRDEFRCWEPDRQTMVCGSCEIDRWHDGDAAEGWAFCQFVCVRGDGGRFE